MDTGWLADRKVVVVLIKAFFRMCKRLMTGSAPMWTARFLASVIQSNVCVIALLADGHRHR